jgi:NADH dehydrogenase
MTKQGGRALVVGGGMGGLFTALGLAGRCDVTLVSPEDHFLFPPMLYEYLSGEVEAWHIAPLYKELLDERVRFVQGAVTGVDFGAREVEVAGRLRRLGYDALVIAVGGVSNFYRIEGAEKFSLPFRKLRHADDLRLRMIDALDRIPPDSTPEDARAAATFAVVGAGASGVELATKMSDLLRRAFRRRGLPGEPRVLVVEMGPHVVPGMEDDIRGAVVGALHAARVEVHTSTRVTRVAADSITFEHDAGGEEVKAAATVWTAGVRVNPLVERLDLEKDKRGLVAVEPTLQARRREGVFALGDDAGYEGVPPTLAGTAQLAFQQSDLAARNVRNFLEGRAPETKKFVELGEAMSLGTEDAAVLVGGKVVTGAMARRARFALYTQRLPTWQHRLKVGASWFFGGTTPRPLSLDRDEDVV